jgi:hypothetical protein
MSHAGKRPPSELLPPAEHAAKRLTRHLANHPDGVSTPQLNAWIDSVRKGGVITLQDFQEGLRLLRSRNVAAFANGVWFLRKPFREPDPPKPVLQDDGPLFTRRR